MKRWEKIKGHESYLVSDEGDVMSLKRSGKLLKHDTSGGYHRVTLSEGGATYRYLVHRLVAEAFIANPLNLPMVNHKNGKKSCNLVSNLEWCTCRDNTVHAFDTNLRASGEDSPNTFRTNEAVHRVCELISKGYVRSEILKLCPTISKSCFDDIRRRRTWVRISKHYNW